MVNALVEISRMKFLSLDARVKRASISVPIDGRVQIISPIANTNSVQAITAFLASAERRFDTSGVRKSRTLDRMSLFLTSMSSEWWARTVLTSVII